MSHPEIYGYWISRTEVYDVEFEEHSTVAYQILERKHGIKPSTVWHSPYSVYEVMFKLGYLRVVNEWNDTHCVQCAKGLKPSKLQKEFIEGAAYTTESYVPDSLNIDDLKGGQHE